MSFVADQGSGVQELVLHDSDLCKRAIAQIQLGTGTLNMLDEFGEPALSGTFTSIDDLGLGLFTRLSDHLQVATFSAERFLSDVYSLNRATNPRPGIAFVFANLNRLLAAGETKVCDRILKKVAVDRLNTDLLLAFLTITFAGRERLPSRKKYYARARRRIQADVGWCEARRLLASLD